MVRGRVLPGRHPALRAGVLASFSQVRDIPGLTQAYMALRSAPDGNEFAVISTWTTPDATMAAFGPELTVYGGCKVNLNFASPEQIAQVLRHAVSGADRWKTEGDNFLLMTMPLANFVIDSREMNLFEKLEDFKELVGKPDQFVNPLALLAGQDEEQAANLPKIPDGMTVREKAGSHDGASWGGLRDVATVEPERIYRVEIITTVGSVHKRLTAVYDITYARSQSSGNGAWLYYRED